MAAQTRAWRAHAEAEADAGSLADRCGKSEAAARERRLAVYSRRGAELERERLSALLSGTRSRTSAHAHGETPSPEVEERGRTIEEHA
jgi:hypothetical protein